MSNMDKTITAVIESADFDPSYKGEDYVTMTFRVPKETRIGAGIWTLTHVRPLLPEGQPEWSVEKSERAKAKISK